MVDILIVSESQDELRLAAEALPVLAELGLTYSLRCVAGRYDPESLKPLLMEFSVNGKVVISASSVDDFLAELVAALTVRPVLTVQNPALIRTVRGASQALVGVPRGVVDSKQNPFIQAYLTAARICAVADPALAQKLLQYRQREAARIAEADVSVRRDSQP
jgi:5-(carboxyamino)imidazole ribonucleotide mutase